MRSGGAPRALYRLNAARLPCYYGRLMTLRFFGQHDHSFRGLVFGPETTTWSDLGWLNLHLNP